MQQSAVWLSTFPWMRTSPFTSGVSSRNSSEKNWSSSCSPKYLLDTLTKAQTRVGDLFPNIYQLLVIAESLIVSTSAVERVFSQVQLTVTTHGNRLAVQTVNKLLTVSLNTKSVEDLNLDEVVKLYIGKKNRRIARVIV